MQKSSYNEWGMNENTYQLLFMDKDLEEHERNDNIKNAYIIDLFTRFDDNKLKLFKLGLLVFGFNRDLSRTRKELSKIIFNEDTKEYEYETTSGVISFKKLSDGYKGVEERKELYSTKRYGKCHEKAIGISFGSKGTNVLTGHIIKARKYLHSVVEFSNKDGERKVVDWTRNLIMSKDQYTKLMNFSELASFEGINYIEDKEIFAAGFDIGLKPYCTFRNELRNDILRNSEVFPVLVEEDVLSKRKLR